MKRTAVRMPAISRRLALVLTVTVILASAMPATASADGDPASDVLAGQALFLPADAGIGPGEEGALNDALRAAAAAGAPIRLAVIAEPGDLGAITPLWRRPQAYAQFLGQELSLMYAGTVLVAMPNGLGVYGAHGISAATRRAVTGAGAPGHGGRMARVALAAVSATAAANGHPLRSARGAGAPTPAPRGEGGDAGAWVAFGVGGALIVLAWGASLRARPLRSPPDQNAELIRRSPPRS